MDPALRTDWDVIVMGGALAGSATALQLRRKDPRLRVLILERSEHFKRRVGESTVEVSALFLGRVLGLTDHLLEHHLPKQGMRFWFMNDRARALDQCSETGPRYNVRLPGYQVDRAVLDEHVLAVTVAEGAVAERGVRIKHVQLAAGAAQTVSWQDAAGHARQTTARWVVDASGVAAILARQEGWHVPNREHPTASCWSRWRGVRSLDGRELATKYPAWANRVRGLRSTATNHLTGRGWWAWIIPLKGGDVSIGVVYDTRLVELPSGPNLGERLRAMLTAHPVGRELLEGAEWSEGDVHFRRGLAYSSTHYATDGAVTVGDAAAFMDPFYSPGMDWVAFSTSAAVKLIQDSFRGRPVAPQVAQHNANFARCHDHWFRALYLNKYYYMGDFDLMTLAFRLDLGMYYLGVVALPFRHGHHLLETPPFSHPRTEFAYRLMAFYNRRLAAIAESRHRRGVFGRNNDRRFFGFISYELNRRLPVRLVGLFCLWVGLELREGWRTWLAAAPASESPPQPLGASPVPNQL
jgi:flavin-dependent dehydrogenase